MHYARKHTHCTKHSFFHRLFKKPDGRKVIHQGDAVGYGWQSVVYPEGWQNKNPSLFTADWDA